MLGLLCKNQYPKGILKGDKANLRRACKNFKPEVQLWSALFQRNEKVRRMGGRFVLEPKKKMHSRVMSCWD